MQRFLLMAICAAFLVTMAYGVNPAMAEDSQKPVIMTVVKFKSKLPFEEVQRRYRERMADFRKVPGLVQKYYLHDEKTGEVSGIYLWASKDALKTYLQSDLKKTIAPTYEPKEPPQVQSFAIVDSLH